VDLDTLLSNPPALHLDAAGNPVPFEADLRVLRRIADAVGPGSRTLETGGGLSTLVFAVRGCEHTCVVPFETEVQRITAWCREHGVPTENLRFETRRSEEALPQLEPTELDLVLVDGGHGFPTPFVDWWYAGRRLRAGGLLVIDDTHLWTGAVLRDFLAEQPGWTLQETFAMRAAIVRRDAVLEGHEDWVDQPYVVKRSFHQGARGTVRRGVRGLDLLRREGPAALRERLRR
jgi:predicted O-methyltransferase YrrM